MAWNLFEKIINAVTPGKKSEHTSEQADEVYAQVPEQPQSWNQGESQEQAGPQEQDSAEEANQWQQE